MTQPHGTLVRAYDADPIYIVVRGCRHHIPDPGTFRYLGYNPSDVTFLGTDDLRALPLGQPLPSLDTLDKQQSARAALEKADERVEQLPSTSPETKILRTSVVALLAVTTAGSLALIVPHFVPYSRGLTAQQREAAVGAFRSALIQIFGAAGVVAGLVVTWHANRLSRQNLGASSFVQMSERYTTGLELVSSEKLTERVGGFLALARIAQASRGDRHSVATLCTVRLLDPAIPLIETRVLASSLAHIRRAGYKGKYHLKGLTLTAAEFTDLDLSYADLQSSTLSNIRALHSSWQDTSIIGARHDEIDVRFSDAQRLVVRSSKVSGDLSWCKLQNSSFVHSMLAQVSFAGSNMDGCLFFGCDLRGAYFSSTDLSTVCLISCDMKGAIGDRSTRWPHTIDPEAEKVVVHE